MNSVRWALAIILGMAGILESVAFADVDREAIVFFKSGAVELPPAQTSALLPDVQVQDPSLEALMSRWGVVELRKCFPDFSPADTLKVSRLGNVVVLPDFSRVYVLTVEQASRVDSLLVGLNDRADIMIAERNTLSPPHQCPVVPPQQCPSVLEPDDEYFRNGSQWYLHNCNTPGADVGAVRAWSRARGSPNVTVAVVDHGVDVNHEEFVGKISGDTQIDPADPVHGTAVASMVSVNTNNGCGLASLNWHARINSQYTTIDTSSRLSGVMDAINAGVDVINMSYGGYQYVETEHALMSSAYELDMVPVAASGNEETSDPLYPARHYEVLSVAATTSRDERATFSNFGKVDVAAPGQGLTVAIPNNSYSGGYAGTSFAAPLVSSGGFAPW